jgi:cyclic pyranopterin phosphate synthase
MMPLTHLDNSGNVRMVDVSEKAITTRSATAAADVTLGQAILSQLEDGDIRLKKGPVFQTAILAGIMGAKETSRLIPLCHPLPLDKCTVEIVPLDNATVRITCTTCCTGRTGVEMEALTGASIAALTLYDMCKALSHDIVIGPTRLLEKTGGRSGHYQYQKIQP